MLEFYISFRKFSGNLQYRFSNNVCDQIPDMSVPYMVVYFSMFKQLSHVYIFVQYAWELFT